jgi:hypothetical protein
MAAASRFSEQFVKDHFVEFGQGMQSMSPALRDLEQVQRRVGARRSRYPLDVRQPHRSGQATAERLRRVLVGRLRMSY